jgi:lipid A ethanolaminephosphotransferase
LLKIPALNKYQLICLTALFLVVTANLTFFEQVFELYPWQQNAGFILSVSVLLFSLFVFLLSLFSLIIPIRWLATFCILVATFAGYFADQFGTIINVDMIRNSIETNVAEAQDLASWGLLLRILMLGVLPVFILWRVPFRRAKWSREFSFTLLTGIAGLAVALLCLFVSSSQYASFFREHKSVRYYTNPAYPIYSGGQYLAALLGTTQQAEFQNLKSKAVIPESDIHRELIILVVGETARADHFSLNGYARNTNPLLALEDRLISYSDISACGTSTAISVPCMFAYAGREDFNVDNAKNTENALDMLQKSGVNILWRDNNSSSKGVADRVPFQDLRKPEVNTVCDPECRDIGMLVGLQDYIDTQAGDILIILHQMGSHGPAYYKRYPQEFEKFTPACQLSELSECTREQIINAYDNTILYTDYFLSKVIALLKQNTPQFETAMFYVGDHGESLGKSGLYLHGMPYRIAPAEQIKVPVFAWAGSTSDIDFEKSLILKQAANSHDAIFDTLLAIFEVETELKTVAKTPLVYLKEDDVAR